MPQPYRPAAARPAPTGCPVSARAAAFDPFAGDYQSDPGDALRWARDDEPVFYSPSFGYWVVTRYEDVKAVFRDPVLFSPSIALEKLTPAPPEAQRILDRYGFAMQRTMVNEDEPQHMERRRLLLEAFLPENLAAFETQVRALTRGAMDRFIDRGRADLVEEVFQTIPLTVALRFLGVADEDAEQLRRFAVAHTLNTWGRPTPDEQLAIADRVGRFWQTANAILDRMRADPGGEGWMYDTIRAHNERPDAVPESYLRSMMMAILAAAHETTSKASANAFWTLLSRRDAWDAVCDNPALIPNAVEECLRVAGSIVAWRRIATAATELGGVAIPAGARLLIVQASANRDPRHWENPDEVDICRDNAAEHLSFGYGAHQCMGKNLARLQMRVFVEEFTRRLPHLRLVPGQRFENLPNISFRGPARLWVEWDPARNPERRDPAVLRRARSFPIGAPRRNDILRQAVVTEVVRETGRIVRLELADPRGRALPAWTPGAHIDLVAAGLRRAYSLCGDPADRRRYRVAILRETAGRGGSRYFHDRVRAGDALLFAGPKNRFRLDERAARYTLIAGGIGITPLITMADRLKTLGKDYTLHYCGAARAGMALLARAERDHAAALSVWAGDAGRRLPLRAVLSGRRPGEQVYVCGPERLLAAAENVAADWPDDALHIERFSAGPAGLDPARERAFDAVLQDSGLTVRVGRGQTLYDALSAAGVDLPCDCGEGLCGTCEVAVLDGAIDHRDRVLSRAERAGNRRMMACCSRAAGARIVLAL